MLTMRARQDATSFVRDICRNQPLFANRIVFRHQPAILRQTPMAKFLPHFPHISAIKNLIAAKLNELSGNFAGKIAAKLKIISIQSVRKKLKIQF